MLKPINYFDLRDKRVLIRVDLNVPIKNSQVVDDFRIRSVLPTITHCLRSGAAVVLMSHLGRPKGGVDPELSLVPVGETLADLLEMPIKFSDDCISEDARDVSLGLKPGEVHFLENLRFHAGETENDPQFSALLAKHGNVYINDAFGTAHRAHASNVGVSFHFSQRGIGFLVEKEVRFLSEVIKRPKRPLVVVLGGAKVGTKLALINRFIDEADAILIGGGMAYTFLLARGYQVGRSLIDQGMVKTAGRIVADAGKRRVDLRLPTDILCAPALVASTRTAVYPAEAIPEDLMGVDIGPETISRFSKIIASAGTVIWNGPLGVFEEPEYETGTREIALVIASVRDRDGISVVGGGDSAAAVRRYNLMDRMSHVSTGGGASLELLSGMALPALIALEK